MSSSWDNIKTFISNDSMSIALFSLFILSIAGQGLSGWSAYNGLLGAAHLRELSFWGYLGTGNFLDGIFTNWEAAILQLAVLIVFGSVLRQRGAAHSRKSRSPNHRQLNWKLGTRSTVREFLYANSLSLAFIALFAVTFVLHLWFGEWNYNEQQALRHLSPTSLGAYAASSGFWFSVFQCWEAEFSAIGIYIVLSIFLRQEDSSESKPVGASDRQTGGANE